MLCKQFSPHVRKSKIDLDSGFHAVDSGLQVLDSGFFFKWNLDSGFQSLMEFQILELYFLCIAESKARNSRFGKQNFPDSGISIPLHGE